MKLLTPIMVVLSIAAAGCSRQGTAAKPSAAPRDGEEVSIPQALIGDAPLDANEILISVNGHELTRAEALRQVQLRLGGPPPADMPPERVTAIQTQMLSKVIDEFVKRELLLGEADRLGIAADDAEIEKAVSGIRGRTPQGRDPQGILQGGPAGKDSLRNEVITGVRIEKLLAQALPAAKEPAEAEIEAFIEENREKLTLPERVRASHILVDCAPDATEDVKARKRELAESYRRQLTEGADFAELATSVSHCPSAARGGDLGVFPRGKMVKAFEDAVFSQKEGEIGEVIETPFGFHVVRVVKHFEAGLADREQVAGLIRQRARALALADYVRSLQGKAEIKHSAAVRPPLPPPE